VLLHFDGKLLALIVNVRLISYWTNALAYFAAASMFNKKNDFNNDIKTRFYFESQITLEEKRMVRFC